MEEETSEERNKEGNQEENKEQTKEEDKKEEIVIQEKETNSHENSEVSDKTQKSKPKDSLVIYAILAMIVIIFLIFYIPRLIPPPTTDSLDELHVKNLQGKLSEDKGQVYDGKFSFVFFDGLWYTQLTNADKSTIFNIPFHYTPNQVEDIDIVGQYNYSLLGRYPNFFMTFDPNDDDLGHIGVSIGEADRIFIESFGKGIIASCTNKDDIACEDRPIVQCNSTDAPVFYFASENETSVLYLDNCIIMAGTDEEIIRATDRVLFDLLGIMG